MDFNSIFGSSDNSSKNQKKIRYAIVALGDISQESMMPGVAHTGNSEITALVTSDPEKAAALSKKYSVKNTYSYEQFQQSLKSGIYDAIYLATPNWRHLEFAVPALKAGIHVLLEKPMEMTVEKCQEIIDAQKTGSAKLMVAYRLHFEPATLSLIAKLRREELGELRYFSSSFSQPVDPKNHRALNGMGAGPLYDMGPYPINAARYVFGDEPTEVVSATSVKYADSELKNSDDTVAVTLKFSRNRIAQFIVSYSAAAIDTFTIVGSKGSIQMDPAYTFGESLEHFQVVEGKESHESFKATDHFGGEMKYFSNCILNNQDPEPDGEEGLADVRVLEGIVRAIQSGKSETLPPFERARRIETVSQVQKLKTVSAPELINTKSPSKEA